MLVLMFSPERASLIELLSALAAGQWQAPTVCPGWSVKDVALHLLGDDIDLPSRRRDGAAPADTSSKPAGFQELVSSLERLNQTRVEATRRISPRLLCELLAVTGEATEHYLASLELFAVEESVSWIRPDPVPNWLDVARQYTERWTHQQQIRDAVEAPGLKEPAFLAPVLATFVFTTWGGAGCCRAMVISSTERDHLDRGKPRSKYHLLVDATGLPLAVRLTAATPTTPSCSRRSWTRSRRSSGHGPAGSAASATTRLHGDKGDDFPGCRRALRRRGICPRIARCGVKSNTRLGRYRSKVERSLGHWPGCWLIGA